MIRMNEHYKKLNASYFFSDIAKRVALFSSQNPQKTLVRLGIGDVTEPLPPACIRAFHEAIDEMANKSTFHGYSPEQGYEFLRKAIAEHDFQAHGVDIKSDEIFVSDGSKCDTANFQELFAHDIKIAITDPVYPVYVDSNVMAGRSGSYSDGRYGSIIYLPCTEQNKYIPSIPDQPVDLIYLCFPNNPTGAVATKEQLKAWVDYAKQTKALILFDAAYVAFIKDPSIPKSIFEIEGAHEVAVEFRSYSKTAGFTGTRCAYVVIPHTCTVYDTASNKYKLHDLWMRRQTTKFNGVSYPVQRAAAAIYTPEGKKEVQALIDYYLYNAGLIQKTMTKLGFSCVGGVNSPYIWVKTKTDSWEFFDMLLNQANVVCTPGIGFGSCGKNYIRLSAFNSSDLVKKGLEQIEKTVSA